MSHEFEEKVAALHRATRFLEWDGLRPSAFNTRFTTGAGLLFSSTLCRLDDSQYLHLVTARHVPPGVDASVLLRQVATESASNEAPPFPPLTDDEPRLAVALLSRLGVMQTTVQTLPDDRCFGFTVRFSFSSAEEAAFQARTSFQSDSLSEALASKRPARKWWQVW